jgi:hypothetical protein
MIQMNIKDIERLANKTGHCFIYDRPRPTLIDSKTIKWIRSGDLTPFGENLVNFANEIEKFLESQEKSKEK